MIGFRKVCEFEIDGERFGHAVSIFNRQSANHLAGLRHEPRLKLFCSRRGLLALLDQQPTQPLHGLEERFPFLLDQHASQQNSQRAYIAPQWELFGRVGGVGSKFGEPRARIVLTPQGRVGHVLF